MNTLDSIREALPDYARDLRLNLASVLTPQGAPGLDERQIWTVALAAAIGARNTDFAHVIDALAAAHLDEAHRTAARTAAAIMGMNNIYYRFVHLAEDKEYATMPARLRMNALAAPGIDKNDFELLSLAVSAVNGCGLCVDSHEKHLRKNGVGREAVQSAARIASVIHAVAGVLEFERAGQLRERAPGERAAA